jgi:hypothetical protein
VPGGLSRVGCSPWGGAEGARKACRGERGWCGGCAVPAGKRHGGVSCQSFGKDERLSRFGIGERADGCSCSCRAQDAGGVACCGARE